MIWFMSLTIYYQRLIDSKEKRACNYPGIYVKISNNLGISYSNKAAKVTKNSTLPLLA